jgi:alcohol dehydrogenase (cytochrome c)
MSPSYDPESGLFYVSSRLSFAVYFIHKIHHPEGLAGNAFSVWSHSTLKAIDYHTGKPRWEHDLARGSAMPASSLREADSCSRPTTPAT